MPYKTRQDIAALEGLSDDDKKDILSLFDRVDELTEKEKTLRTKSEDADKTAKRAKDLEKLVAERDTANAELRAKLDALTIKSPAPVTETGDDESDPLAIVRKTFSDMVGDTEETKS